MIIPHYYLINKGNKKKDIINDKIKISNILSKIKYEMKMYYKIINSRPHYYFIILFDSNNIRSRKSTFEIDTIDINIDYDSDFSYIIE